MKRLFVLFFLIFFLVSCSSTEEAKIGEAQSSYTTENKENYNYTIVAFGDSLTEGYRLNRSDAYPAILERELRDRNYSVKVYNSGYSGETSTGALERVNWVLQLKPDIVILETGPNDALRGIDLSITRDNIDSIVKELKANNVTVILAGMTIVENLGEEYVREFETIYPSIAQENNITLIPFFLEGVAGVQSLNLEDEIHPNKKGYEIVAKENVMPYVIMELEKLEDEE